LNSDRRGLKRGAVAPGRPADDPNAPYTRVPESGAFDYTYRPIPKTNQDNSTEEDPQLSKLKKKLQIYKAKQNK
jgi:hypothetical protein